MLFNLASVIDWQGVTAEKQSQVYIDNVRENAKQVTHDDAIGYQAYVEMTEIYCKLAYKQKGPYRMTEVFINGTVWVQIGKLIEHINIIWLTPHFIE